MSNHQRKPRRQHMMLMAAAATACRFPIAGPSLAQLGASRPAPRQLVQWRVAGQRGYVTSGCRLGPRLGQELQPLVPTVRATFTIQSLICAYRGGPRAWRMDWNCSNDF